MSEVRTRRARAAERGVTLVEVLIVVAIMSMVAGAVTMVAFPELKKARIRTAAMGAVAVREAAKTYREIDLGGGEDGTCPTVQDLVSAKKLEAKRIADPWGSQYAVGCDSDDIHATSPGHDRTLRTPDDVRDDLKPADVETIARL